MSDPNEDPNAKYDSVRCRTCGCAWDPFTDEHGRIYAGHPYGQTCSRYRPSELVEAQEGRSLGYVHVEAVHANGRGS